MSDRRSLAVWKFASCDGCQLSILDCEDELLALAGELDIAYFAEAGLERVDGEYDISIVEGSITTAHDAERIREIRARSRRLVSIGACATAGGIQALRNFADVEDFVSVVYASPQYISTLQDSTPIADHVAVDFELNGCPPDKGQLLELISAYLNERKPQIAGHSVCIECKRLHLCKFNAGMQPRAVRTEKKLVCPRACHPLFQNVEAANSGRVRVDIRVPFQMINQ